jgi:hypothetical protein
MMMIMMMIIIIIIIIYRHISFRKETPFFLFIINSSLSF